jgi:C4-dicarboxylate transporter DctM subunit
LPSPERLVGFFRGLFGWAPAGTAVAAVAACAFFTAVTGASGVTILALGGLLLPILVQEGYPRRFAIGLLTASGSIGLLFPPSLPVILYGIRSEQPIENLFLAGIFPGILIVAGVAAFSALRGRQGGVQRTPFDGRATLAAVWRAKWDLFLPVFVLLSLLAGMATLVEAAALTAAYAIFIEVVIHRTLSLRRDTVRIFMETAILMGALLFILGSALGLTGYMVGEEIPARITQWVQASVHSKVLFLLTLNVLLLVTGMLLDIFSAIIIVVPLIIPLGEAFGVNPIHLGIIFLCNLELGYLTPPVGLNLFLSSLRFRVPLAEIWRTAVPFLLIFGIWVFLITYVPALTLGLL